MDETNGVQARGVSPPPTPFSPVSFPLPSLPSLPSPPSCPLSFFNPFPYSPYPISSPPSHLHGQIIGSLPTVALTCLLEVHSSKCSRFILAKCHVVPYTLCTFGWILFPLGWLFYLRVYTDQVTELRVCVVET